MQAHPVLAVMASRKKTPGKRQTARLVRDRIEQGGERIWRLSDFQDLPFAGTARALSRLAAEGLVQRLSKGVYYRSRPTTFGKSLPNPAAMQKLASKDRAVFPSGITAANLLGFTTQTARRGEVATSGFTLPRKLLGPDTVVHTRRPEAWIGLSDEDAAMLDFLRRAGKTSELPVHQTIRRTMSLLSEKGRLHRLLKIAATEPPRARALLGALGEQIGIKSGSLAALRTTLNPLSRFDFGIFSTLPNAASWQAKLQGRNEPVQRLEPDRQVFRGHRHFSRPRRLQAAAGEARNRPRAQGAEGRGGKTSGLHVRERRKPDDRRLRP
jgi:hypothetical protein